MNFTDSIRYVMLDLSNTEKPLLSLGLNLQFTSAPVIDNMLLLRWLVAKFSP